MTREEAIQVLTEISATLKSWSGFTKYPQAIDMAIEALSQPIVAKHFDIQSGYIYCSPQIAENLKVVVRCKDCCYWDGENQFCTDGGGLILGVTENDYCSRGERADKCE